MVLSMRFTLIRNHKNRRLFSVQGAGIVLPHQLKNVLVEANVAFINEYLFDIDYLFIALWAIFISLYQIIYKELILRKYGRKKLFTISNL